MRQAKNCLTSLQQRGIKLLGIVLNGITADSPYYYDSQLYQSSINKPRATRIQYTPPPVEAAPPGSTAAPAPAPGVYAVASILDAARLHAQKSGLESPTAASLEQFKARRAAKTAAAVSAQPSPATAPPPTPATGTMEQKSNV